MKKAMLLSMAIALCAALALAQDTPSSSTPSQDSSATASSQTSSSDQSASSNTVRGCLTGASGNYMLTDATGLTFKVQGDDSELSANVNKEVEVMGTLGSSASASASNNPDASAPNAVSDANANAGGNSAGSTGATATATASKTLNATSVKMVADSCSTNK